MASPVAIFVYNRLDNTSKTIEALRANTLARQTDVYVFSDGGKDKKSWKLVNKVRRYLHEVQKEVDDNGIFRSMTIVERKQNIYLERNIIEGISYVFEKHPTVIVLEDDIVTSPFFLDYMNQAFTLYKDNEKVMHVSGFTNLDLPIDAENQVYFTPHPSGWGWGTWRTKWQKHFIHYKSEDDALIGMTETDCNKIQYDGVFPCLRSLKKSPIPWDICWELAIYKVGGLCITPRKTLVKNVGLASGTHFKSYSWIQYYEFDRQPVQFQFELKQEVPQKSPEIEAQFKDAIRDWGIRYTWIGKSIRYFYKNIMKHLVRKR